MPNFTFITYLGTCYIVSDGVKSDNNFSTVETSDNCKNRIKGIASKRVVVKLGVEVKEKEILHTKFSVVNIVFIELRELINFIKIELSCSIFETIIRHDLYRCNRKLRKVIA